MRSKLSPTAVAALLIAALCCASFLWNLGQPLVRNGFVYARAAEHVAAHGFDPRPVVADSKLSYDKPIGFAWVSAPFVAAFGNHTGLRIVSLLGTLAYLLAAWRFLRAFDPFGLDERERGLALLFAGLSPIVVYQSWSAHPDALFAAVYLGVFVLTLRIAAEPTLARISGWFLLIVAGVLLKNYAQILVPSAGLYLLVNVRRIWSAPGGRRAVLVLSIAFALLGAFLLLAWLGKNPLARFEGEGGGVGQYGKGNWWIASRGTLVQLGLTIALSLHVAVLGLVSRTTLDRRLWLAFASFPIPYVLGLMVFPTTFYNMRYFVPVLPFAAVVAVAGLRRMRPGVRRVLPALFAAVALALVVTWNVEAVYVRAAPWIPKLEVNWIGVPLSLLDNLRMPLHLEEKAWIANVNARVEPGGILYLPDASYYVDARHGVFERAGLLRADVHTRYVASRDFAPAETHFWVQGWRRDPALLKRFGQVEDLGLGLMEVRPAR